MLPALAGASLSTLLLVVFLFVLRHLLHLCRASLSLKEGPHRQTGPVLSLDVPSPFLDLLALPRPLALAIFALLPVDTRLRCSEVCRAWRALLADTSLWASCINLSVSSGVARLSEALLRAAVAKAGGQLRALDITGQRHEVVGLRSWWWPPNSPLNLKV